MAYNPYVNLIGLAGMNVLKDQDPYAEIYVLLKAYAEVGAAAAANWILSGKQQSREQEIEDVVIETGPLTEIGPISECEARKLIARGFDWILQYEVGGDE